jgi:hypothetical protein
MRHIRMRALVPTLALVLALATGVRADCADELRTDGEDGTAVLIGTEELSQEYYVPVWAGPTVPIVVKAKFTSEIGIYQMSDGSRIRVLCDEKMELA